MRFLLLCLSTGVFASGLHGQPLIAVRVTPKQVIIERTKDGQDLNFDFLLQNNSSTALGLVKIRLTALDPRNNILIQKSAWSGLDATLPSSFVLDPKKTKLLLNPFFHFDSAVNITRLKYEFVFEENVAQNAKSYTVEAMVAPLLYQHKTRLVLPLSGRVLVYEGHDYYAHHRRVDLTSPVVAQLGVTTNPTRYGYDFMVVNTQGASYRTDGKTNDDWLGFGTPILSPGAGIIKEVRNSVDDNILGQKMFDFRLVFQDIKAFYGNYVIIDHRNGEYSLLLHLKKGSVLVKPGDPVVSGQRLAQMGLSGDTEYVHLHYQLQNATEMNNETLPAYFSNFRWWLGPTSKLVREGSMESGDIVESLGPVKRKP